VANVSRIGLIDDACKDHVDDTGPGGEIGNTGADGSSPLDRL
jgi:hypothetical protein